jgi:hypothetical protein
LLVNPRDQNTMVQTFHAFGESLRAWINIFADSLRSWVITFITEGLSVYVLIFNKLATVLLNNHNFVLIMYIAGVLVSIYAYYSVGLLEVVKFFVSACLLLWFIIIVAIVILVIYAILLILKVGNVRSNCSCPIIIET